MAKSEVAPSAADLRAEEAELRVAIAAARARLADLVLGGGDTTPARAAIRRDETRLAEIGAALGELAAAMEREAAARVARAFRARIDHVVSTISAKLASLQPPPAPTKEKK